MDESCPTGCGGRHGLPARPLSTHERWRRSGYASARPPHASLKNSLLDHLLSRVPATLGRRSDSINRFVRHRRRRPRPHPIAWSWDLDPGPARDNFENHGPGASRNIRVTCSVVHDSAGLLPLWPARPPLVGAGRRSRRRPVGAFPPVRVSRPSACPGATPVTGRPRPAQGAKRIRTQAPALPRSASRSGSDRVYTIRSCRRLRRPPQNSTSRDSTR